MGVVTRAKKMMPLQLDEEEEVLVDRISLLPDGVLEDIVSLLPTRDAARTQLLSSRWRHIWRSAPLNLDVDGDPTIPVSDISRILSTHQHGPGRRFSINYSCLGYYDDEEETLDGWLRSPALDGLRELEILFDDSHLRWGSPPRPLPAASVLRFSSTLVVASFNACAFPDATTTGGLLHYWPLLKQLTLSYVTVSESSLHALLAGCPALESLLLQENNGCPRVRIVSPSLRSIGVGTGFGAAFFTWGDDELEELRLVQQLVIEDAPCLEKLVVFEGLEMDISVVSAPRLKVLGELVRVCHMLQFCTAALHQGSTFERLTAVVPSVKVLALSYVKPCSDTAVNLIKCFPHLEKLYIKITHVVQKNESYDEYQQLTGTLDIRLRNIVLPYREDSKPGCH
ncbi:putative F-box/FBD/LRR-repeat protein At1g78760 [Panicum hallii]|uniref:putative F-box/FBD/LRR-repeat protein At1g78760 n=1 Tax=Panicum hallii TaxID=206008 RepID=UPI000DF4E071|nr:putative F-box/FBD/LRR-repeat protein At1g78760 [Panicum hallii]